MTPPRIFLDTNALKYACDRLPRFRMRRTIVNWGGDEFEVEVGDAVTWDPNLRLAREQRKHVFLLPAFADLAKREHVELVTHFEGLLEFWGLPNTDDPRGLFYGAPVTRVDGPFEYARAVTGSQAEFMGRLNHHRFLELQRATGAFQGEGREPNPNQLVDAFLIWCAESCGAEYFLTCDRSLVRAIRRHRRYPPTVQVLTPAELLGKLLTSGALPRLWPLRYLGAMLKSNREGADDAWVLLGRRRNR